MHEGTFKMYQDFFQFQNHEYGISLPKDFCKKVKTKYTAAQQGELIHQNLEIACFVQNHTKLEAGAANQMRSVWGIGKSLSKMFPIQENNPQCISRRLFTQSSHSIPHLNASSWRTTSVLDIKPNVCKRRRMGWRLMNKKEDNLQFVFLPKHLLEDPCTI